MTSSDQAEPARRLFEGDYPDHRKDGDRDREHREVAKQVQRLIDYNHKPELVAEVMGQVQRRREGTDGPRVASSPTERGGQVFVEPTTFVLTGPLTDGLVAELRGRFGLVVADVTERSEVALLRTTTDSEPILRDVDPRTLLNRLRAVNPRIQFNHIVPLGGVVKAEGGPEPTTLRRDFPAVPIPGNGTAARVAVIDTGVTDELRTDGYLDGLADGTNVDPLDVFPPPGDGKLDLAAGHGTSVIGVIQQVGPSARITVFRTVNSDGCATDYDIGQAILAAADAGANIINLSLGSATVDDQPLPAIRAAIEQVVLADPDILIVCAAGNDGSTTRMWPAAMSTTLPQVVAVAGLDPNGLPSTWSSRGSWVTCSTIGQGVATTYVIGTEDGPLIGDPDPDTFGPDSWAVWTGTSFAAPQITGAVARRCHEGGLTPRQALDDLLAAAPPIAEWGRTVVILPGT